MLNNPDSLRKRLDSIAEKESNDEYQKDIYYSPAHKNFLDARPISQWLRIRQTREYSSINYKHWHTNSVPYGYIRVSTIAYNT